MFAQGKASLLSAYCVWVSSAYTVTCFRRRRDFLGYYKALGINLEDAGGVGVNADGSCSRNQRQATERLAHATAACMSVQTYRLCWRLTPAVLRPPPLPDVHTHSGNLRPHQC